MQKSFNNLKFRWQRNSTHKSCHKKTRIKWDSIHTSNECKNHLITWNLNDNEIQHTSHVTKKQKWDKILFIHQMNAEII